MGEAKGEGEAGSKACLVPVGDAGVPGGVTLEGDRQVNRKVGYLMGFYG